MGIFQFMLNQVKVFSVSDYLQGEEENLQASGKVLFFGALELGGCRVHIHAMVPSVPWGFSGSQQKAFLLCDLMKRGEWRRWS